MRRLKNFTIYKAVRVAQTLLPQNLILEIGRNSKCVIPSPPDGVYAWTRGIATLLKTDPFLQVILKLTRNASHFWDVGAHHGIYSMLAKDANPSLSVVSIEASTDNYAILCKNWQLQPDRWICVHSAAGDRNTTVVFTRKHGGLNHISTQNSHKAVNADTEEVRPMITIDSLATQLGHRHIDVLKLDVEGAELFALQGADALLNRRGVGALVIEADGYCARYSYRQEDISAFLKRRGYAFDPTLSRTGTQSNNFITYLRAT